MRHEGEQDSPRQRRQERQHQFVQLVGHHGQEAEEEELHYALAIHFLRRSDPPCVRVTRRESLADWHSDGRLPRRDPGDMVAPSKFGNLFDKSSEPRRCSFGN